MEEVSASSRCQLAFGDAWHIHNWTIAEQTQLRHSYCDILIFMSLTPIKMLGIRTFYM